MIGEWKHISALAIMTHLLVSGLNDSFYSIQDLYVNHVLPFSIP